MLKAPDVAEMWTDRQTGWDYSSDGIGAVSTVSARTVSSYKADVVGGNMTCLCVNVSEKTVETVTERFYHWRGWTGVNEFQAATGDINPLTSLDCERGEGERKKGERKKEE